MLVAAVLANNYVSSQQSKEGIASAKRTALAISKQIATDRIVYTDQVMKKLLAVPGGFTGGAMTDLGASNKVPLPASFVHLTSDIINHDSDGYHTVDLRSLWNINPSKGPSSEQERKALEDVARDPTTTASFIEGEGSHARMVVITADVASSDNCVSCHNHSEASPKRDFKKMDVMGGLIVSVPLKATFAAARQGAISTTLIICAEFLLVMIILSIIQVKFVTKPLAALEKAADHISSGVFDDKIPALSNDEVGRLGKAFDRMRQSLKQAMKALERK